MCLTQKHGNGNGVGVVLIEIFESDRAIIVVVADFVHSRSTKKT
jgi:hypothetical protein